MMKSASLINITIAILFSFGFTGAAVAGPSKRRASRSRLDLLWWANRQWGKGYRFPPDCSPSIAAIRDDGPRDEPPHRPIGRGSNHRSRTFRAGSGDRCDPCSRSRIGIFRSGQGVPIGSGT
jgi:hypothetical protein